jgi:hypothetical protein
VGKSASVLAHGTETRARVEELQRQLTAEIETIQSGDDWRRMLQVASRLHRYSANNLILISVQHTVAFREGRVSAPIPTYVAGFRTWKALGRSVDKGQKGYAILAPAPRNVRLAVAGSGPDATRRPLAPGDDPGPGERLEVAQRLTFRIEHVFDVSQTSGAPLPEPPRPQRLVGGAPRGLFDELERFAVARGYTVSTAVDGGALPPGADGVTRFDARTITLRAGLSEAAAAATLVHELGHVLLHDPARDPAGAAVHRGIGEVEAESVAYIVTAAHGMDSSSESLPYVATWAGGRRPAEVVQRTAQRVVIAAHELLTALHTTQHPDGAPPGLGHDAGGTGTTAGRRRAAAGTRRTCRVLTRCHPGPAPRPSRMSARSC